MVDSEIVKTCDELVTCKEQGCRGTSQYPQSCWIDANLLCPTWCQTKKRQTNVIILKEFFVDIKPAEKINKERDLDPLHLCSFLAVGP